MATRLRKSQAMQSLGSRVKTHTPKKLSKMMARCRELVNDRMAEMRGHGDAEEDKGANLPTFDLVGEVTIPYAVRVCID